MGAESVGWFNDKHLHRDWYFKKEILVVEKLCKRDNAQKLQLGDLIPGHRYVRSKWNETKFEWSLPKEMVV